ncbi:hypothetical protein IQ241_21380 [Romeria aff. gracilis LEGE 07310]|uniref:Uncharacterized protein n=1 Tax=Vasconcelosia minhoensis LEGE 07310 TaxID=915328 RepID=A0A8J7AIY3_9CYAN|nr:hypothetical protein [Romeria gracilis]MBE9079814.1 hypothetical protein [Romeria aff. gracilis LEGE 07310]
MSQLSPFTCRRLNQLPKLMSVWEGDRRRLTAELDAPMALGELGEEGPEQGDCILWVDGTQGVVRALSMVPAETGPEAMVRALVQAIERPQSGVEPARPRKIVVRDREIQFFLRGALQNLDIDIEYVARLPLVDDILDSLQIDLPESDLPAVYAPALVKTAEAIWRDAPWEFLSEQEILAVELNCWEIETLYISVLGMAGVEYGLLLYRSLNSLKQFRRDVLSRPDASPKEMQQVFLEQDCLFINFEPIEAGLQPPQLGAVATAPNLAVSYDFGSLHPLEGMRSDLADEEAATFIVALEALHRFFTKHHSRLQKFALESIESRFRIPNPMPDSSTTLTVKVRTLPDIAAELIQETDAFVDLADPAGLPPLQDDCIPEGSIIVLTQHSLSQLAELRAASRVYYQALSPSPQGGQSASPAASPWPVLLVQTTRPKAQLLVQQLRDLGGVEAFCFNPGSDPISGSFFQVGLLQTGDGSFHLVHEYEKGDPTDERALALWAKAEVKSQGCCAIVIAAGSSGIHRGRPRLRDIMALFEARVKAPHELDLEPLVLRYAADW